MIQWMKSIICFFTRHQDETWPHIDLVYLTKHERSKCITHECNFCGRIKSVELGRG